MSGKLLGLKGEPTAVVLLTGRCILSFKLSLMKSSVTGGLIFILGIPLRSNSRFPFLTSVEWFCGVHPVVTSRDAGGSTMLSYSRVENSLGLTTSAAEKGMASLTV